MKEQNERLANDCNGDGRSAVSNPPTTTMKSVVFILIISSILVPQTIKTYYLALEDAELIATISAGSCILFAIASYLTWKGLRVARYITCGYLACCGLLMLPWLISPLINSELFRFLLALIGLFWIASAVWVFKQYPQK